MPQGAISIHAPREGSDTISYVILTNRLLFQSTLPARGATHDDLGRLGGVGISIHAPREGSDPAGKVWLKACDSFQSTLPARGATMLL